MKRKSRDYQEKLIQDLQNTELANAYLSVALADENLHIFFACIKKCL